MRALAVLAIAGVNAVAAPGGSNYSWYQVDRPAPGVCVREQYGVIPNFGRPGAHAAIKSELAQMIASGQRKLRIGIFHAHGIDTGTVMDSTGGDLSAQNRRNLGDLLGALKAAGFTQVEVAFHPEGPAVREWTAWRQDLYDENFALIRNLRPLIRAAGLPYVIDLSNEAIPTVQQPLVLRYARTLWAEYTRAFGRTDTVGFSVIGDPAHVNEIPAVYGGKPPYVFDIHFYGGTSGLDEYQQFVVADRLMRDRGLRQPRIIGEAFYDDAAAADELQRAIAAGTRRVWYLTQWPLSRGSACSDVDVGAPTAFGAYARAGFATAARPRPLLVRRRLDVDQHGAVALVIGCDASATPCSGTVDVRLGGRAVAPRRVVITPPRTTTVRVHIPQRTRARSAGTVTVALRSRDSAQKSLRSFRVTIRH
jgi:hypothetical protein